MKKVKKPKAGDVKEIWYKIEYRCVGHTIWRHALYQNRPSRFDDAKAAKLAIKMNPNVYPTDANGVFHRVVKVTEEVVA